MRIVERLPEQEVVLLRDVARQFPYDDQDSVVAYRCPQSTNAGLLVAHNGRVGFTYLRDIWHRARKGAVYEPKLSFVSGSVKNSMEAAVKAGRVLHHFESFNEFLVWYLKDEDCC